MEIVRNVAVHQTRVAYGEMEPHLWDAERLAVALREMHMDRWAEVGTEMSQINITWSWKPCWTACALKSKRQKTSFTRLHQVARKRLK
jgi:hypothetical protein